MTRLEKCVYAHCKHWRAWGCGKRKIGITVEGKCSQLKEKEMN